VTLTWLPKLGLGLDLALDGLSMPMVLLTALLTAMAVLASPADQSRPRLYYPLMLATNLGVTGAFLAQNALLFVLAFELVLIPTTLLVAIWGDERRSGAAGGPRVHHSERVRYEYRDADDCRQSRRLRDGSNRRPAG
jgi:NAD(P)H-quinone oxidoreductase subunit 4